MSERSPFDFGPPRESDARLPASRNGDLGKALTTLRSELMEHRADFREEAEKRRATEEAAARLHGELRELRARIRRDAGELRGALERTEELRRLLVAREREVEEYRSELHAVRRSRLWRFGEAYWTARTRLQKRLAALVPGRSERRSAASSSASASSEERQERRSDVLDVTDLAAPGTHSSELPTVPQQGYDVVCFPIIDWYLRIQRPQQLMRQFAAHNHRVFYVSPVFDRSSHIEAHVNEDRIWQVRLPGSPDWNLYEHALMDVDVETIAQAFEGFCRELSVSFAVMMVQLPFWTPLAFELRRRYGWPIVYDCMDEHSGFVGMGETNIDRERTLLEHADLVVTSSNLLFEKARRTSSHVALIPNAAEFEHFAQATDYARPKNRSIVVGYYGAIAHWFDTGLVADLARSRPEWSFELIGGTHTAEMAPLEGVTNVTLFGELPYAELPDRIRHWDCCVIPFRREPLTEATNPVKVYEMLAAGKPVVAVDLPELRPLSREGLIHTAENAEQFAHSIQEAIFAEGPGQIARRKAYARRHTWARRFFSLRREIAELPTIASVIIVTFNNRELTQACLDSVFRYTDLSTFEVIVVDNASTDGTPQWLDAVARRNPRLRLIRNSQNRGFAAANNQGLAIARGEILCLLNNDTIVTRGWLPVLMRHLYADSTIGLIGPVTNTVGNEAKVAVRYGTIADLHSWAEEFVRRHAGESFEIRMLAMFCLAMRRGAFEQLGPLDERFEVGMFEDDDYACRARAAGFRVVCVRDAFVHHWGRAAFGKLELEEYDRIFAANRQRFQEKWGLPWQPHQGPAET